MIEFGGGFKIPIHQVVPPGRGEQMLGQLYGVGAHEGPGKIKVAARLTFRDAAGRHWLRDKHGYLYEVKAPPR
ncbi:hypothetical protein FHG89_08450 [Micromonospora orduensis]|uniref:Uncharacterized protein n=1 Tax=Micromonospora orduensis TaxID=1420891 RepID=A0A5C4QWC5_9ACTN|nr:hypothetical protein [Micromonospora orduensis]TNH30273.1 hypothetical protein FHG89_08450 [Micromonospora orduensis]